jgi:hypothetical protein
MTDDILNEKRKRRKFERMWRASKLTVHYEMYCMQRDKVNALLRKARGNHFEEKVTECGTNQKALFAIV